MDDYSSILDEELLQAYQNTDYEVPSLGFSIQIGRQEAALNQWLKTYGYSEWVFITAENPGSQQYPSPVNQKRNVALLQWLQGIGFEVFAGAGVGRQGNWPPEASWWIPGCSRSTGCFMGKTFGQNAIVWGTLSDPATLVSCR
jgi:hypothetical protein